jgi:flagellar FliL protein
MAKNKEKQAEAETPPDALGEGETGKKKPPLKLILIAAAGALVVLGGGGGAAMLLLGHGKGGHHVSKIAKADKGKKNGKDGQGPITEGPDGVVFYTMPDMVANIQSPDGRPAYLKLKLAFELSDESAADAIEPNAPRLNDMFQTFLRELRPEDLAGSQGSYQLRMEILRRVNLVIAPAKVNAVLIQEMLIQ